MSRSFFAREGIPVAGFERILMKIIISSGLQSRQPQDWFHGSIHDFDRWNAAEANKMRGTHRGADPLGMWLVNKNKEEYGGQRYGPIVYRFNHALQNPYIPQNRQNFWGMFIIPEVAAKFMPASELKKLAHPPSQTEVWRMQQEVRDLQSRGMPYRRQEAKLQRLQNEVHEFDAIARKLFNETGYVQAVREFLKSKGHDSVLIPDYNIERLEEKPGHNVAVMLGDEYQPVEKFVDQERLDRVRPSTPKVTP